MQFDYTFYSWGAKDVCLSLLILGYNFVWYTNQNYPIFPLYSCRIIFPLHFWYASFFAKFSLGVKIYTIKNSEITWWLDKVYSSIREENGKESYKNKRKILVYLFFFIEFERSLTLFPWKLNLSEIISKIKVPLYKTKMSLKIALSVTMRTK